MSILKPRVPKERAARAARDRVVPDSLVLYTRVTRITRTVTRSLAVLEHNLVFAGSLVCVGPASGFYPPPPSYCLLSSLRN